MIRRLRSLVVLGRSDTPVEGPEGSSEAVVQPGSPPLQRFIDDRRLSVELRSLLAAWSSRDLREASSDARALWDFLERKRPLAGLLLNDERTPLPLREALRAWLDRAPEHAIRDAQLLAQILGAYAHAHPSTDVVGAAGHEPIK